VNKSDWARRKRSEETLTSFLSFLTVEEIPQDYLSSLSFKYENGRECWLDLLPKVSSHEVPLKQVISFLSYVHPERYPPKEKIINIEFKAGKKVVIRA
jgi:hypothetical protein